MIKFAMAGGIQHFTAIAQYLYEKGMPPCAFILSSEKDVEGLTKALQPLGIPLWSTDNIGEENSKLRDLNLDVLLCVEFPGILKKETLSIPKWGCLNLHTSRLPDFRGRHPVQWAMIEGEKEIGITLHWMNERIDEGDLLLQDTVSLRRNDDLNQIQMKLRDLGCQMVHRGLSQIEKGVVYRRPQDPSLGRYFRRRTPADGKINFEKPAWEISRLTNSLVDPMPNAFAFSEGRRINFKRAFLGNQVGEVLACTSNGLYVIAVGDGVVLLASETELQIGTLLS